MKQAQGNPRVADGDTHAEQQEAGSSPAPRTPNERDASADSQAAGQGAEKAQHQAAARDAAQGQPDTGTAPEMDRVYNEQVRDGASGSDKSR